MSAQNITKSKDLIFLKKHISFYNLLECAEYIGYVSQWFFYLNSGWAYYPSLVYLIDRIWWLKASLGPR